ncbi:PilW family protein [Aeromonas enteropelogenes]|uniref:PilW family protein n=1 Tax=Aeromonas enteropelogenes TaxID=29489 RepID=UPI003BA3D7A8
MLNTMHRQRGVSLVELMIAMVLGLLLMLAVFAGYAPIKRTVAQSKALEQASEVLRFATLTFTSSIKQADRLISVTPDRLTLGFRVEGGAEVLSCLGNRKTADFTEQYRFTPPVLSCDDGEGARLLVTGLKALEFGEQGSLVTIRILPEGLPAYLAPGVTVQVARRKAIWDAALAGQAAGGAG